MPELRDMTGRVGVLFEEACTAALLPLPARGCLNLLEELLCEADRLCCEGLVPMAPVSLTLALVTDRESAALNLQALRCPGPTNILSFPGAPGEGAQLALACETLARESQLYGQKPLDYLIRLLAHGTAHVCGLDHGSEMEAAQERLEAAARACLAQI
ncbi:MAG: rRNA maturation RNase YbeY [Desulfovibrionaceae bacterium]|nr:rRNA maturation RNase YbeY [Desulfovibrionaceae bacterium]